MITIELEGKTYNIKNTLNEVTVKEFEELVQFNDLTGFELFERIFEVLSDDSSFLEIIDIENFIELCKDFNNTFNNDLNNHKDFVREIKDPKTRKTYTAFNEGSEFKITATQLVEVEREIKKEKKDWISFALSVFFKAPKSFTRTLTLDIAIPYIIFYVDKYSKNLKLLADVG